MMIILHFKSKTGDGVCFCEACHKLRGSANFATAGDPPKSLNLPINWVLFPLRGEGGAGSVVPEEAMRAEMADIRAPVWVFVHVTRRHSMS